MVQGCLDWQRDGLRVPAAVEQATAEYRDSMDPLNDFITECCVLTPGVDFNGGASRRVRAICQGTGRTAPALRQCVH